VSEARPGRIRPRVSTVVIEPSRRWRAIDLREMWAFRDVFWALGIRDLKLRYRQTLMGAVWVVLQPLLAAGIFAFVFGRVAGLSSDGVPYVVFSYAGLMAWNAFSETVTKASAALVVNRNMISKIYFPRLLLPLSSLLSSVVNFGVSAVVLLLLLFGNDISISAQLLTLPGWLLLALCAGAGLGLVAGALNVLYRDVGYAVPVIVQMLLYASPVAYAVDAVPAGLRPYIGLNPLTGIMEGMRWAAFDSSMNGRFALWSVGASLLLLLIGAVVFRSIERRFADVI
jgi:lipopolysaccharide transport system permease protein